MALLRLFCGPIRTLGSQLAGTPFLGSCRKKMWNTMGARDIARHWSPVRTLKDGFVIVTTCHNQSLDFSTTLPPPSKKAKCTPAITDTKVESASENSGGCSSKAAKEFMLGSLKKTTIRPPDRPDQVAHILKKHGCAQEDYEGPSPPSHFESHFVVGLCVGRALESPDAVGISPSGGTFALKSFDVPIGKDIEGAVSRSVLVIIVDGRLITAFPISEREARRYRSLADPSNVVATAPTVTMHLMSASKTPPKKCKSSEGKPKKVACQLTSGDEKFTNKAKRSKRKRAKKLAKKARTKEN